MLYRKLWLQITTLAAASLFSITISAATLDVPKEYETIQDAIDAAVKFDTISVAPGTYTEDLTLNGKSDITLQGQETARTILRSATATASKPILTISGSSKTQVKNFTWQNAQTGISVSDSTRITIAANIFTLGVAGTGVTVAADSDAEIVNNTFYENKVGISRSTQDIEIINNFFAKNLTAILNTSADATNISYNGFYRNTTEGPLGTSAVTQLDPLFVDIDSNDFHVRAGSPVIDKGISTDSAYNNDSKDLSDLGAYGGQYADTFPYPVSAAELTATVAENTYSATLKWNANSDYRVTGYNAYHYVEPGASAYPNSSVPVDDTTTNSAALSGPIPTTTAPATPALISVTPRNQVLTVTWTSVTGATGYELHYGVDSSDEHSIPTGNVSSYALTGLENGVTYKIRVLAVAQAVLHAAVKAHDADSRHLSNAYSKDVAVDIGPKFTSDLSNEASGIPEATVPYPLLPNEGCFIATAAYGHYSAPQVQALRDFRDRYLLTHRAGRVFVTWYYDYGPTGAHYLNEHPALKPSVRVLLYPFVIGALFLTQAPLWSHLLVLLCVILLAGHLVQRRWMNISPSHR